MECQPQVYLSCADNTVIFGPKTGKVVHVHLRADEIIRLDAFTISSPITISIVDKNPGADCADCGTGITMPYAPCGDAKTLSTLNRTQYIRGPGVFELSSESPSGVPYVKATKISSISDVEFCNQAKQPCVDATWTATEEIRCTETFVEKKEISNCGNVRWVVQGPQTWTDTGDTRCTATDVEKEQSNDCGKTRWIVSGSFTWSQTGQERCVGVNVEREEKNNCGVSRWVFDRVQTWIDTGETRCANNVVESQQENDCGNIRWTSTTATCGYCPSLRVSCDGQSGFGYHINDPKDPAATVEMAPCAGDTSVDALWIYPSSGTGHTIKVTDCDGALIGYAANKSECAGDCGCP